MMTLRIDLQSSAVSPKRKQIDSRTILTAEGGLDIDRISTKCCRLILLTATDVSEVSRVIAVDDCMSEVVKKEEKRVG
jgi:hypothetical protein